MDRDEKMVWVALIIMSATVSLALGVLLLKGEAAEPLVDDWFCLATTLGVFILSVIVLLVQRNKKPRHKTEQAP